jgi:tyrosine phenol-lyase
MTSPYPFEPFRIKMIERLRPSTREERRHALAEAGFNLFAVPSRLVLVDLLTDSGTGAMSDEQWGAMMTGDEAYAGSRSFSTFEDVVHDIFGFPHVIPTHQCRAAEHILFELMVKPGDVVPSNCHFDTTRANVEAVGGIPADCILPEAWEPECEHAFKGDMDLDALEGHLQRGGVPFVMATITNNSIGGQPVSLANLRAVSAACKRHGVPFILDACRFAENAWFIHELEVHRPVREIVREMFALADGCTMSAKKDGLANIGGFFACRDADLAGRFKQLLILYEGFPTYGGLAGRDLAAIAQGLGEVLEEDYLAHRIGQVRRVVDGLDRAGVPVVKPAGGHAAFIDARRFLPHVPPEQFPGQALACALFVESGVRACEIGTLMFGKNGAPPRMDLVRLAIPRRVYTASHLDYVISEVIALYASREKLRGYRILRQGDSLRHFTARLAPMN